jgi:hypothetical protein
MKEREKWREDEGANASNYRMIWRRREWELQEQALDLTLRRAGSARGQRPVVRLYDVETYRGVEVLFIFTLLHCQEGGKIR